MQLISTISSVISAVFNWLSYADTKKKRSIEQSPLAGESTLPRKKAEAILSEIQSDASIFNKLILFFLGPGLLISSCAIIGSFTSGDGGAFFLGLLVGWFTYATVKYIVEHRINRHMQIYHVDDGHSLLELKWAVSQGRWDNWYVKWLVKKILSEYGGDEQHSDYRSP